MLPANQTQQYDSVKVGIAVAVCLGVLLIGLTLADEAKVREVAPQLGYLAAQVAPVTVTASEANVWEPQPTPNNASKQISDDGKSYVVKALAGTRGMASCRFDSVDETLFADGGAQSTHSEGIYVSGSGTYVQNMSGGDTYEWLYLGDKTYRKEAKGKWTLVPLPQLPPGVPTPSKDEAQAVPHPTRIPMWDNTNLDAYEFGPAYEEMQGTTKVIHVTGKAAAQGIMTGESSLDVWVDSATGYLYMFAGTQDLNVEAQKEPLAFTSSDPSATPADWRPIAQYRHRVVLKNINGYDNTLPTP